MKSLVILAAGMWSRYGWLKQLDWFGPQWETILEYSIYDAIRSWFEKIIFVIRKDFEKQFTEKLITSLQQKNPTIVFVTVFQWMESFTPEGYDVSHREKPRGTAHAVLVAKEEINGPFCVINADDRYGPGAYMKMNAYFDSQLSPERLCMVWYVLDNTLSPYGTVNRGVCEVVNWNLHDVNEHLKIKKDEWWIIAKDEKWNEISLNSIVSMNFWWFHQDHIVAYEKLFLQFIKDYPTEPKREFFIPTVVDYLVQEQWYVCEVIPTNDPWCGVTYQDDKPFVQQTIQDAIDNWMYPEQWIWNAVS